MIYPLDEGTALLHLGKVEELPVRFFDSQISRYSKSIGWRCLSLHEGTIRQPWFDKLEQLRELDTEE